MAFLSSTFSVASLNGIGRWLAQPVTNSNTLTHSAVKTLRIIVVSPLKLRCRTAEKPIT